MKPARFALIFFPAFIAVLALLRLFLAVTEPYTYGSNVWAKARIHASLRALADPDFPADNAVLFLGASEAMTGFSPADFDIHNKKAGRPTRSLNLAVHNVGTFLPLYFDRVALELERAKVRPKIIFVNFPISRLTTAARAHFSEMQKTHDLPSALFEGALWNTEIPFQEKAGMAVNKWVFGERSLLQIPLMFSRAFRYWTGQIPHRADQNFMNVMIDDPARAWVNRGGFYTGIPEASEGVLAAKESTINAGGLEEMIAESERCCDFRDLKIDQAYAGQIKRSLARLRGHADHVVIVHLAENFLYQRTAESEERRQAFLKDASVGESVWSFSYPPYEYIDLLHLSPRGSRRFSDDLAEKVPAAWIKTGNK